MKTGKQKQSSSNLSLAKPILDKEHKTKAFRNNASTVKTVSRRGQAGIPINEYILGKVKSLSNELLGVKAENSLQFVKAIERGFSFDTLERLQVETGLPIEVLGHTIGISSRTLSRRKKERKLSVSESDRLASFSRLYALSVTLFEGMQDKAVKWLVKKNRALGDVSPIDMAATETGAREVENLIGRLEHGVFS